MTETTVTGLPQIIIKSDYWTLPFTLDEAMELLSEDDLELIGYYMESETLDEALAELNERGGAYTLKDLLACYLEISGKDLFLDMTKEGQQ